MWPLTLLANFQAGMEAYERGDFAMALEEWRPLALQGNASAQNNLGVLYDKGLGVAEDDAEAVRWYGMASEQVDTNPRSSLSVYYGQSVPQDYVEALRRFRLGAEGTASLMGLVSRHGNAAAQYNLGVMYNNGLGVAEAVRWYRMAAEQEHANARTILGFMYGTGQGVPQDHSAAARWHRLAAEQRRQDHAEAMQSYRRAAEQKYADAWRHIRQMRTHTSELCQRAVQLRCVTGK